MPADLGRLDSPNRKVLVLDIASPNRTLSSCGTGDAWAIVGHLLPGRRPREGELMGIFSRKKDEKKVANFSNVQSGSSSTAAAPASVPPPAQEQAAGATYTVAKGDSLSKIAKQFYGDANQWRRIYEANRDQISNPDLIHPGQNLKIPGA